MKAQLGSSSNTDEADQDQAHLSIMDSSMMAWRVHESGPPAPPSTGRSPRARTAWWGGKKMWPVSGKKQGAAGITTAAPCSAGQWGRGNNRLSG